MDIVDKDDNTTWRNFYETINEIYFEKIAMFTDELLELCKK